MRGAYKSGQRRVLTGSIYKIIIGVVIAVAVALVLTLLAVLPAMDDEIKNDRTIVSIENVSDVGTNFSPSQIYVRITYSDGSSETVALANTEHAGLDTSVAGNNTVVLSYGGFQQTINITVKNVDCRVRYIAGLGGKIQGEQEQMIPNGGEGTTVIAIPEPGYVFVNWNDGYPYATRKDSGIVESKDIQAIFERAQYTVIFYYNDGTVASEKKVRFGESPANVPNPDADPKMKVYGYKFSNWVPNDFSVIDRDMVIRPEYVKDATDVTMEVPADKYGNAMGSAEIRTEGYYANDELATIVASPYISRVFSHWEVADYNGNYVEIPKEGSLTVSVGVGGEEITFSSTKVENENYQLSFTPKSFLAHLSLRAIFAYSASDITFINYQDSANNNVFMRLPGLPYGKSLGEYQAGGIDLSGGLPTPNEIVGLNFLGWYIMEDETQTLIDETAKNFKQPTSLVAKWERKDYTVIFSYVDDLGVEHEQTTIVKYQDAIGSGSNGGIPSVNPQRKDYNFIGWQDALTGQTVDDKTKLYAEKEHMEDSDFTTLSRLRIIPIWRAKSHMLRVDLTGSGKAILIIDENKVDTEGQSLAERVEVTGETEIFEDRTYKLAVEALDGFAMSSYVWYQGETAVSREYTTVKPSGTEFVLLENMDNSFYIVFDIRKFNINLTNGSVDYSGYVDYNGSIYNSVSETLSVNYNGNADFTIVSGNEVYSIADITVNGVSIGNVFNDEPTEYSFTLSQVNSDVDLVITYSARKYSVNFSVGEGGDVFINDFYDPTVETVPEDGALYLYDTKLFLKIKGSTADKVVSSLRINGDLRDFYRSYGDNLRFYDRKVNGVDYAVDMIFIDGEYYYRYGEGEYADKTYVYTQRSTDLATCIFEKNIVYGEAVYTAIAAELMPMVASYLYSYLDVASCDLSDTVIVRDNRLTEISLILAVRSDINISVRFDSIDYEVTAAESTSGRVTVSNEHPAYNGTSVLVASPAAGYYVAGYYLNGVYNVVNTASKGDNYSLTLSNVTEDKNVEFDFEKISYRLVLYNTDISSGTVYSDGQKLNPSLSYNYDYHAHAERVITVAAGKRISALKIGDTVVPVHYNMTSYKLIIADLLVDTTVEVTCDDLIPNEAAGTVYDVTFALDGHAKASAQFVKAAIDANNGVYVTSDFGYVLNTVTVRDKNGSDVYVVPVLVSGEESAAFAIPANTFDDGADVEIRVTTSQKQYLLTTAVVDDINGVVSTGYEPYYGETVLLDVSADQNCYIEAVYLNGEELSFEASYWSGLTADPITGNYTGGTFSYVAEKNMDLRVSFKKNAYKVSVDPSGVNGDTVLSIGPSEVSEAEHGSYIIISMTAEDGYHVSELYVNGVKVTDLTFETDNENERKTATYLYRGAEVSGSYTGVTGRLNVKTVYDINRYSFVYNLVNDSANFSSDAGAGTLSSSFVLTNNVYSGIEHGSNFSFDVTPAVSNGYYLYSVKIEYTSATLGERTVYKDYTSGYFSSRGDTIWFNRFVDDNDGVIADITGITATFRRNLYQVALIQEGEEHTGILNINFTHPSSVINYIVLYKDGEQDQANEYYYRAGTFYKKNGLGELEPTDIALRYDLGSYRYMDGLNNEYDMYVEHGLRYVVTARPTVGYERVKFTINAEDLNSYVSSDNTYSTNIVRNISIVAGYRILTYDLSFSATVVDKNLTGLISPSLTSQYMRIAIEVLSGKVYDDDYNEHDPAESYVISNYNSGRLDLYTDYGVKLGYGAKVRFVMTPNFSGLGASSAKGYYLYNFFLGESEATNLAGDRQVQVTFGGETGVSVVEDISARCSFRIMRYRISTAVTYSEDILGENLNRLISEDGGTVAWGDSASIKVVVGTGYTLNNITVKRGDNAATYVNLIDSADDDEYEEQMYYNKRNQNTNEIRDLLYIKNVTSDIVVTSILERQGFVIRYKFNNSSILDSVTTYYNDYTGYPSATDVNGATKGYWEDANTLLLNTKYYDELRAVVTPKNGYKIDDYILVVRAVSYDDDTDTWVPVVDNNGDPIVTYFDFNAIGSDVKSFTFHRETSQTSDLYVMHDLEVSIALSVKTYTVRTSVTRVDGANNNNNLTSLTMKVVDKNGDYIRVGDGYQEEQLLEAGVTPKNMKAEHHGKLSYYDITATEGFVLTKITVNGYVWEDFANTGFTDERMSISISKSGDRYRYSFEFKVKDELIAGYNYVAGDNIDVRIEFSPIVYSIKAYINDVYYENAIITDRQGVTDDETLSVYLATQVSHYSTFGLSPAVFEGYRVTGLSIFTGTEDEKLTATNYNVAQPELNKSLAATFANLKGIDVLNGKTTIHIYYTTDILRYTAAVDSYVYTLDDTFEFVIVDPEKPSEGYASLDSAAGVIDVTVLQYNGPHDAMTLETYDKSTAYPYFSTIRVDAYALDGYVLYGIMENDSLIVNGVRGVTYFTSVDAGDNVYHTFMYDIDSLGNRSFKVLFKQRTQVSVRVPNPYKYINTVRGVNNYQAYVGLKVRENGAEVPNINDDGTVQELYTYNVLVGNYVSFEYNDITKTSAGNQIGCTFMEYYDEQYHDAGLTINPQYPAGIGRYITNDTELYLITNVYNRVTFTKETYGAMESNVGGTVYFNNSGTEPNNGFLYTMATAVTRELIITAQPNANYVFSKLSVRQIDNARSKAAGYVIFKTGSSEWLSYSTDEDFAGQDSNHFKIRKVVNAQGNTEFRVTMTSFMELKFEFYRIYELKYAIEYANEGFGEDNYCYPQKSAQSIEISNVDYNEYAPIAGTEDRFTYVQYGSSFILTAPLAPASYKFVGWYVNGINTYEYLDTILPTDDYVIRAFDVRMGDLNGIVVNSRESTVLDIVAVYQPVIEVTVFNELYYYDDDIHHWNSWMAGGVRTEYFDFDGFAVPTITSSDVLVVTQAQTLNTLYGETVYSDALAYYQAFKSMHDYSIPGSSPLYTGKKEFSTLYQYILNGDYLSNSWQNGYITFTMEAMPSTVKLVGWQYYNWNTNEYEDILYSYEDRSYGMDASGQYTIVDNTFTEYTFDLSYLYNGVKRNAFNVEVPAMPYALNALSEDNSVGGGHLIIRPKLWKLVRIELTQMAYLAGLGSVDFTDDFGNIIHPRIADVTGSSGRYDTLSVDEMTGVFDYGAKVNIVYYDALDDGVVRNYPYSDEEGYIPEERYRFIGWQLFWTVSNQNAFRFVVDDGNNLVGGEIDGMDLHLIYNFGEEPPREALEYMAVYIKQYRQSVYSYNVAGSTENYNEAYQSGYVAVEDAPSVEITINAATWDYPGYYPAAGSSSNVTIPYIVDTYDMGDTGKSIICFADAGSEYYISMDDTPLANARNFDYSLGGLGPIGYDPDFDKLYASYRTYKDGNGAEVKTDFTLTSDPVAVACTNSFDFQYASDVIIEFNNVMYNSGVTLPYNLVQYLTDGDKEAMTVWDVDAYFGDGTTVADGKIVLKFRLTDVHGKSFFGSFDYSLNGFTSGNGITAAMEIFYYTDTTRTNNNGGTLFDPNVYAYRRYISIDYNDGYIKGGSLLFGDESVALADRYKPANTGIGMSDNPYRIFTRAQLINLGRFFNANGYSCIDKESEEPTHFLLCSDIKLQNVSNAVVTNPADGVPAWVPLTYHYSNYTHEGFDGVFDGNNHVIYGLAADDGNIINPSDKNTDNPLSFGFDYEHLAGYGIFGSINGGTVKNLILGNAYIDLQSFENAGVSVEANYVGVLTARAYDATFENITFSEAYTSGRTANSTIKGEDGHGTYNGSRVYLHANNAIGVGLLAGCLEASKTMSTVDDVTITISTSSGFNIDITSAHRSGGAGALVGYASGGNSGNPDNITVDINDVKVNGANHNALSINYGSSSYASGGLIGIAENGVRVVGASVGDATSVNMFVGSTLSNSSGGIIGRMSKSVLSGSKVVSRNENTWTDDTKGVFIMTKKTNSPDGAGGQVGYADNSRILSYQSVSIKGVFFFDSIIAGGIVGTSKDSLVQGFNVNTPNVSNGARLMMPISWSENDYGGIVGRNTGVSGKSIIDDCSVTGSGSANAAYSNIDASLIYVYRREGSTDTKYRNAIADPSAAYDVMRKTGPTANQLYVGGIVGYNDSAVYNSFTKYTRITVKYENGASSASPGGDDYQWGVYLGGIVGYFNVKNTESTYFGWNDLATSNNANANQYKDTAEQKRLISRVQSCYTYGSSLAFIGYVWCDNLSVEGGGTNKEAGTVATTLGGIVGGTSTSAYGEYAINSCYSYGNHFIRRMGAFGLSNDSENPGDANVGWYLRVTSTTALFIKKYGVEANRAGFKVDGGIFGIVSGRHLDDTERTYFGGAANYCWCKGNTSDTNSWTTLETVQAKKKTGVDEGDARDVPDEIRGITYNNNGESANNSPRPNHVGGKYPTFKDVPFYAADYYVSYSDQTPTTNSTYSYRTANNLNNTVNGSDISILFIGGFLGTYGALDGRVASTDIETGMLKFAHVAIDNTVDSTSTYDWYVLDAGETKGYIKKSSGYIGYKQSIANAISAAIPTAEQLVLRGLMVRGQTSAISS